METYTHIRKRGAPRLTVIILRYGIVDPSSHPERRYDALWGVPGVVANVLDCYVVISEFEPDYRTNVHFQTYPCERQELSYSPPHNKWLNSTTSVLLK